MMVMGVKDSGRLMSLERIALQTALNYSAELIENMKAMRAIA